MKRFLPFIILGVFVYAVHAALVRLFGLHGIPNDLLAAIIQKESSGNPRAIGSAGEIGLMQIKPAALSDYNREYNKSFVLSDLFNPKINKEVGAGYLSWLKRTWRLSTRQSLIAYNAGIGNYLAQTQPHYDNGVRYANDILRKV